MNKRKEKKVENKAREKILEEQEEGRGERLWGLKFQNETGKGSLWEGWNV